MSRNPKSKIENLKSEDSAECAGASGPSYQISRGCILKSELITLRVTGLAVLERHAPIRRSWKSESLGSLEIIFQLKEFQTRHGGYSAVVGQKRLAITHQCGRYLDRIRRLEFERCSKLGRRLEEATINLDKSQTSASRQQRLITIGKRKISGPIRNNQNFHQTEAGCHSHELAAIDRFKQRLHERKKTVVFLDKIDKNLGIERDRTGLKGIDQSHSRRSLFTCLPASTFFQTSFPSPWRSKMERGSALSVAALRI